MPGERLLELGFREDDARALAALDEPGLVPARVVAGHTRYLRVLWDAGETLAEVAGGLKHAAAGAEDLPAVGDWVALRLPEGEGSAVDPGGAAAPHRRSCAAPPASGTVAQVLAANVDTVFLVMGLDGDFNPRRLERALVLAWESGALPVVLLNKADLADDLAARRAEIERVAVGVPVCALSAKHGEGLDGARALARGGPHRGAARVVGRRQVDAREPAARDARSRRRSRCVSPTSADATPRRTASSSSCLAGRCCSTRRACASCSSGRTAPASTRCSRT